MKKAFRIWVGFISIVLILVCLLAWFTGTNQGARFTIERVTRAIPARIHIGEIHGKLAGGLELNDIHVQFESWEVSAKRFYIRWNPFHFLGGWLEIREAALDDVVINNLYPEVRNPYNLSWPQTKGFLSWIKARIRLLHINGFMYKEAGHEAQKIERVRFQLIWYLGGLNVSSIFVKGAPGVAEGSLSASLSNQKLTTHLQLRTPHLQYGLDRFQCKVGLERARNSSQTSGPMVLIGMSGHNEIVKLSGTANITSDSISLDNMELKEMGRQGTIGGSATLNVSIPRRPYELSLAVNDVAILKNQTFQTSISGALSVKGDISGYEGFFNLKNKGTSWKAANLEGALKGNFRETRISHFRGSVLGGAVGGTTRITWTDGIRITGTLEAKGLNPATITPDWPGSINGDLITNLYFSGSLHPEGSIKASLHKSVVRKRPLTGTIDIDWKKGSMVISRGELHGNGFDISAWGILQEKIDYQVNITDLGGLIPQAGGRFASSGWLSWNKSQWAGVTKAEGHSLRVDRFKVDSVMLHGQINDRGDDAIKGKLQARNAGYGPFNLGSPAINVEGKLSSHDLLISLVWPKSSGTIVGHGGYKEGVWQGTLSRIEGKDPYAGPFSLVKPVTLSVSNERISMTPLTLTGSTGESVEMTGDMASGFIKGNINVRWEKINLARANQFLNDIKLDGQSSGSLEGHVFEKERLKLTGASSTSFSITRGPVTLRTSTTTKLHFDEKGMRAGLLVGFQGGGKIEGQFESGEPAYFKKPESGNIKVAWDDLDMAVIKSWLPQSIDLKGKWSGAFQGKLLSGSRFELSGDSKVTGSSFTWNNEGGIITSHAENASMDFYWKDHEFRGNLDVRFPSHGKVKSAFRIPVNAQFPVTIAKKGAVDITANGEIREKGIVSALFPGFIEESKGQLTFEFSRTGTWETPEAKGRIKLENAAAYFPTTGTRMKEGSVDATFVNDRIECTSFVAKSGAGKIEGSGTVWLKQFGIDKFKAKIGGERFQAIYLPELQVQTSPDLTLEGDANKILIRGTIRVPEAVVRDVGGKASVQTSQDAVIIDAPLIEKKPLKIEVDIQSTVVLGDKVKIHVAGLEGRIEGSMLLTGRVPEKVLGKGMMKIVNGKYNSYGIKLDVTRGNIIFDGGPVDKGALDIMAIRTFNPGRFDEVKAGVTVSGTLNSPLIKLYSEPSMTDTDVLSYMVIGRPIKTGAESKQTALLLKSASAMLGGSKAAGIQDQLQQRLGLDTFEVQEGAKSSFTSSRTSTSPNAALDQSLMTVGKYLSPDLYISYGRSLFNEQFLLSARYTLTRRLEIESKTGMETSVDLFYKIEFD